MDVHIRGEVCVRNKVLVAEVAAQCLAGLVDREFSRHDGAEYIAKVLAVLSKHGSGQTRL